MNRNNMVGLSSFKIVSWNLGSLQTNPFEFWQPIGSSMRNLQLKMDANLIAMNDVALSSIFTRKMFEELISGDDKLYDVIVGNRSAGSILTDPEIGQKRFVSLPDRITRSLPGLGMRPSVMTGFEGTFQSIKQWWILYLDFMRQGNVQGNVLKDYDQGKYGRAGLTDIEIGNYKKFQMAMMAAADAVLVQIALMNPGWESEVGAMNRVFADKFQRVLEILDLHKADVVCLQEVDVADYGKLPSAAYHIAIDPAVTGKQTSVILLRKNVFRVPKVVEVRAAFLAPEDLLLIEAEHISSGHRISVASFHGDTRGQTTLPVLELILEHAPSENVVIGSDANTHRRPTDGKLPWSELVKFLKARSCQITNHDAHPTTRNARTFFQPQSHKGCHASELDLSEEPKDWIIIRGLNILESGIDFTGRGEETTDNIPNAIFPSDHALMYATVTIDRVADEL